MGNAKPTDPSSAYSTKPSSLTNSDFNDSATACSTNTSPNTRPYTATLVGGQSSSSSDGPAYKNNTANHGNHQDDDGTSDIGSLKDNTEPDHPLSINTVSPSIPPDELSDGSTANHDDHGHNGHQGYHGRHQHRDDVGTSGKDEPEPIRPTPTKVPPRSRTASNDPENDPTPPEASSSRRQTQLSQVHGRVVVDMDATQT